MRRVVERVNPATCDKDYSPEMVEWLRALSNYKQASGRTFPSNSEIFSIFTSLGYSKGPAVATVAPVQRPAKRTRPLFVGAI